MLCDNTLNVMMSPMSEILRQKLDNLNLSNQLERIGEEGLKEISVNFIKKSRCSTLSNNKC